MRVIHFALQTCVIDLPRTVSIQFSVGANKVFDCIVPITAAWDQCAGRGRSRNAHGRSQLGDRSRAEHPEGVGEKASRVKLLLREDVLSSTEEFLSYQSASNVVTAALKGECLKLTKGRRHVCEAAHVGKNR